MRGKEVRGEDLERSWLALSEEVVTGMREWREQHPQAALREIELALDERLGKMRARMLQEAALASAATDWQGEERLCPECGKPLVRRGKRERRLQTQGGCEVVLERSYGVCPACGAGLFPPGRGA